MGIASPCLRAFYHCRVASESTRKPCAQNSRMVERDEDFENLLEFLRDSRGFDFTGYKRSTLSRRVMKRMGHVGIDTFSDYLDYLQVHPAEFGELFHEILINVTSFFRDPDAWQFVASAILPELTAGASAERPLRCWCAGVASGEEAYTLGSCSPSSSARRTSHSA